MKLAALVMWLMFAACAEAATAAACVVPTGAPPPASGWDTIGDSILKGVYNFRYVQYTVGDQQGDLSHAAALYGTICFDGIGNYTIAATPLDSNPTAATPKLLPGTYSISATGFGFLS